MIQEEEGGLWELHKMCVIELKQSIRKFAQWQNNNITIIMNNSIYQPPILMVSFLKACVERVHSITVPFNAAVAVKVSLEVYSTPAVKWTLIALKPPQLPIAPMGIE